MLGSRFGVLLLSSSAFPFQSRLPKRSLSVLLPYYSKYNSKNGSTAASTSESMSSFRNNGRGSSGGGRGAYYRNKYGGGGRDGDGGRGSKRSYDNNSNRISAGGSYQELRNVLQRIDGRQYPSYHDLETDLAEGSGWVHPMGFTLQVGRAQSDPFAPPTRCRLYLPQSLTKISPAIITRNNKLRCVAAADYVLRRLYDTCRNTGADQSLRNSSSSGGGGWSGTKGGDLNVMEPTQHVLEQSAVQLDTQGNLSIQLTINLPARGRTVLGQAAERILDPVLTRLVQESIQGMDHTSLLEHVDSVQDQAFVQSQLEAAGLVAFVRNSAILPRQSGVNDRPMSDDNNSNHVVPFQSPPSLQCEFRLPNAGTVIQGMGIPKGVTLICGGFHGKSTLLQTLQLGVYFKIPGDGREFCVTSPTAVKIRAEDGRSICAVDISPFIKNLPFGRDTTCFHTEDASGSTSQASNIVESVEMGVTTLLIDEDTCATNFMIRDNKMQQLVSADKEPITPFISIVQSLYAERQVSTVLVVGGSGDYFDVADHILLMDNYRCEDATQRAKEIAKTHSQAQLPQAPFGDTRPRFALLGEFEPNGKVKSISKGSVSYGNTELEISALEQIVSITQTNGVAAALQRLATIESGNRCSLRKLLETLDRTIEENGIDALAPGQLDGQLSRPRILEVSGAVNRLRRVCIHQG